MMALWKLWKLSSEYTIHHVWDVRFNCRFPHTECPRLVLHRIVIDV